ncbi:transposase [Patescibacteria group bacterium]|nr:transposase [Patescibacteria group bacterium]
MATIRKEKFVPGEYYHIYSRTILNIPEFRNKTNAQKLLQSFLIANSTRSSEAFQTLRNDKDTPLKKIIEILQKGERMVDVLCYAIMPDHYHLLLREIKENGISNFILKCNTSIAKYINIKNDRKGALFENRFKSKHINSNEYLLHLSLYIHLNPLDFLVNKNWRVHKLKNWNEAKKKLLDYPWSSIKYFLIKNHEDSIISGSKILNEQFANEKEYEFFLREWSEQSTDEIKNYSLE